MMASRATPAQLRKIYVLARETGMDSDLLHLYVSSTVKKDSLSRLTVTDAVKVIDGLSGKKKSREEHATKKQEWKIKDLAKKLGWLDKDGEADEGRLNGFLSERMGVLNYRWLSKKEASNAIEAFKSMLERQEECEDGSGLQKSI